MKFTFERTEVQGILEIMKEFMMHLHAEVLPLGLPQNVKDDIATFQKVVNEINWADFCEVQKNEIKGNAVTVAWNDFYFVVSVNPEAIVEFYQIVPAADAARITAAFIQFCMIFKTIDIDQIKVNAAAHKVKWDTPK